MMPYIIYSQHSQKNNDCVKFYKIFVTNRPRAKECYNVCFSYEFACLWNKPKDLHRESNANL